MTEGNPFRDRAGRIARRPWGALRRLLRRLLLIDVLANDADRGAAAACVAHFAERDRSFRRERDRCGDAAWVMIDVTSNGHALGEIAVTLL